MTHLAPKRTVAGVLAVAATVACAAPAAGALPADQVQGSPDPQSAPASARFVPEGPTAGLYCGRDYSQNSAGGHYCVRLKAATASPPQNHLKDDGSSWSNAELGAAAALALLLAGAGSTAVLRRRRATSGPRGPRTPATT